MPAVREMQETQVRFLGREDSTGGGKWPPTPVFSPGDSQGPRSLTGYSPWGCRVWSRLAAAAAAMRVCLVTQSCPTLATPWTVACQAPQSLGFSRQDYWSGLPFPSPSISSNNYIFLYPSIFKRLNLIRKWAVFTNSLRRNHLFSINKCKFKYLHFHLKRNGSNMSASHQNMWWLNT